MTGAVLLLARALTVGPRLSAVARRSGAGRLRGAGPAVAERAAGRRDGGDRAAGAGLRAAAVGAAGARSRRARCSCWSSPPLARDPGFALSVLATAGPDPARAGLGGLAAGPRGAAGRRRGAGGARCRHASRARPVIAAISGQVSLVVDPGQPAGRAGGRAGDRARRPGGGAVAGLRRRGGVAGLARRAARSRWLVAVGTRAAHVPAARAALAGRRTGRRCWSWPGSPSPSPVRGGADRPRVALAARWRRGGAGPGPRAVLARLAAARLAVRRLLRRPGRRAGRRRPAPARRWSSTPGPEPVGVDGCLRRLGVRSVPLLVLTHLHADHVDGLDRRAARPGGRRVDVGPPAEPAAGWREVQDGAARHGVPVRTVRWGSGGSSAALTVDVLAPDPPFHGTRSDPNNSSVVLRVAVDGADAAAHRRRRDGGTGRAAAARDRPAGRRAEGAPPRVGVPGVRPSCGPCTPSVALVSRRRGQRLRPPVAGAAARAGPARRPGAADRPATATSRSATGRAV